MNDPDASAAGLRRVSELIELGRDREAAELDLATGQRYEPSDALVTEVETVAQEALARAARR